MNQQQLQTARAALWHQTAPLLTADEASAWLEDLGLCLFLPRRAQLPAPAPSFVEAVHGAASAASPAAALEHAGEIVMRLVDERRLVPLNLLGTYSEQADFLVTPEVLPWISAIRGDRQWNAAPGGRTAPLVVRTWQVLDREGEATAVELREHLGRELTEAAVLRALIELWTTLRAMPVYRPREPTRWTLLKNRYPAQTSTGANTAQATALSAMLSIYLRSAVAATAEEAEIFLSPLTARSRIREVIHGMTAARQFGTMSVGPQTLLFVEGSLPEHLPVEEPEAAESLVAASEPAAARPQRAPGAREFQGKRRPLRSTDPKRRNARPPFEGRRENRSDARPWQKRQDFREAGRPSREPRPPSESRTGHDADKRPGMRPPFQNRPYKGKDEKPWQKRREFRGPERPPREQRPPVEASSAERGERRPNARPWDRSQTRPGQRPAGRTKPWQRGRSAASGERADERPRFERGVRPPGFERENRPDRTFGKKPGQSRFSGPKGPGGKKPGVRPPGASRPKFGASRPKFGGPRPKFGAPRPKFPPKHEEGGAAGGAKAPGNDRRPRFGKPRPQGDSGRPVARVKDFKRPGKKNFRKAGADKRNPRKNRTQGDQPE